MPLTQMASRMAIAFGAAAAAGAAQLGIGYGLGVFSWLPTVAGVDDAAWQASLTWTVWITATSVVLGSLAGDRGVGLTALSRLLLRIGIVLSAALGGVAVALLIALPSQAAVRADTFAPETIVGGYAIAGVLLGLAVALAAVHLRPIAINIVATTAWLWLLAAVAFADALGAGRDLTLTELSVWHVTIGGPMFRGIYLPGAVMVLTASLLIGGLAAWPIARAEGRKASAALSGAGGPILLAGAYLLTAPAFAVDLFAPSAAVLSGLIGSVAITGLAGRRGRSGAGRLRRDNNQPTLVSAAKPKVASDAI